MGAELVRVTPLLAEGVRTATPDVGHATQALLCLVSNLNLFLDSLSLLHFLQEEGISLSSPLLTRSRRGETANSAFVPESRTHPRPPFWEFISGRLELMGFYPKTPSLLLWTQGEQPPALPDPSF